MKQRTLKRAYNFEGKGLHTGTYAHISLRPAPAGTGIKFIRTDIGRSIPGLAEYVSNTARCTLISEGRASVSTIEHVMSAFAGMGVDNAIVEVDNLEIPILDGSARFFAEAIAADGLEEQEKERRYYDIKESLELRHEATGSWIKVEPADHFSIDVTVDFGSHVLGVQKAHWDESVDYLSQIAVCRTFVFFHEVQYLAAQGLVKGGDVDNAIVVVERPVPEEVVADMAVKIGHPGLRVLPSGYLSNITLNFPDECGRHKLLDLLGDMRLCGGYLRAHITAYKPGHTLNTDTAKAVQKILSL